MVAVEAAEQLRSAEYLAAKLGVHRITITRWVNSGRIKPDETHVKYMGEGRPEQIISLFRESTVERLMREFNKDS